MSREKPFRIEVTAEERDAIERKRHPRDVVFSRKFRAHDIDRWREAAEKRNVHLVDWVEEILNRAAETELKGGEQ